MGRRGGLSEQRVRGEGDRRKEGGKGLAWRVGSDMEGGEEGVEVWVDTICQGERQVPGGAMQTLLTPWALRRRFFSVLEQNRTTVTSN